MKICVSSIVEKVNVSSILEVYVSSILEKIFVSSIMGRYTFLAS